MKQTSCPECGSLAIGEGKYGGYANITPTDKLLSSAAVSADVCTECGLIFNFRVKKPEIFKGSIKRK